MNNKLFLAVVFSLFTFSLNAQAPNYVDWEWDIIKFGFVEPTGGGITSSGGMASWELRYNLRDDFSLGIEFTGAFFSDTFDRDADVGVSGSFLVNGDYYFSKYSNTRGFIGLGFGRYEDGTIEFRDGNADDIIRGTNSLGIAPRAGFELGHGRLLAQFNMAFDEDTTDYFSISLALTLWGGYKGEGRIGD